jgi:acyl-CoA-binding protein
MNDVADTSRYTSRELWYDIRTIRVKEGEPAMSDLQAAFERAAQEVQQLPRRPDNETLLQLYALYKQATVGDVQGNRPGVLDMTGRLKYDAWAKLKGVTATEAMSRYIKLVERLKQSI